MRCWIGSVALLAILAVFCRVTTLGRNFPELTRQSLMVWSVWRPMDPEERRLRALDETYPVVAYLRDTAPADAVILLPPRQLVVESSDLEIPVLASASAV